MAYSHNGSVDIGSRLSRCRRENGVTQAQLAEHLGVTKAAVSKWELGQNLPDIAHLPRIAAFFGISIDELLEYSEQSDDEERTRIVSALVDAFIRDFDEGFDETRRIERAHWRDWPLLAMVAATLANRALYRPDRYDEAAAYLESLLARIEDNCGDIALARNVRMMRASLLLDPKRGRVEECIEMVEPLVAESTGLDASALLAAAYDGANRRDDARALRQRSVYAAAVSAVNGLLSQMPGFADAPERLGELARAVESIMDALRLDAFNPPLALSVQAQTAAAFKKAGRTEEALHAVEKFCRALDAAKGNLYAAPHARDSALFDAVADEMTQAGDAQSARMMEAMNGGLVLDGMIASILAGGDWSDCEDDARFQGLLARCGEATEAAQYWAEREQA